MAGGREGHETSCAVAKGMIVQMQERTMTAYEMADQTLAAIIDAVGEPPATESGRFAFEFVAKAQEDLNEVYGVLQRAIAELDRYAGGF